MGLYKVWPEYNKPPRKKQTREACERVKPTSGQQRGYAREAAPTKQQLKEQQTQKRNEEQSEDEEDNEATTLKTTNEEKY